MRTRHKRVVVYLTEDEFNYLTEVCCKTRISKTNLFRYLLLGYTPPEGPPVNYDELIFQLRALGNNINQILHIARINGILNPKELQKHLTELQKLEKKMDSAFEMRRNSKWQSCI